MARVRLWRSVYGRLRVVSLSPPPASWEDAILEAAVHFMNAEVCFYEPTEATPYDPVTGTGGVDGVNILWQGKARIQQLRSPREFQTDYQAESSRAFRYQLDPRDNPPSIGFGVKSRILNGGRDADLERLVLVTNSAINSSHMAVRTVELVSNMEFVDWAWSPWIPRAPWGLTASGITSSGFTVTWEQSPGDPAPFEYQVEVDGGVWLGYESGTSVEIDGATPSTQYVIRVRARIEDGEWGAWSAPLAVNTEE